MAETAAKVIGDFKNYCKIVGAWAINLAGMSVKAKVITIGKPTI